MTLAIWTLSILMMITIVIGFIDIFKEIKNQFCRKGVVTDADFESKHPASHPACRVFDFSGSKLGSKLISENRLALKKQSLGLQAASTISTISKSEGKTL